MTTINYKIAVLGRDGVGKTSSIERFILNTFNGIPDPTSDREYPKQTEVDSQQYNLNVIDTYGNLEEFSALREQSIRKAHGFLLVYSVADIDSFNKIKSYCDEITRVKDSERKDIPIVLVGNKCDMEDSCQVTREQGEELARQLNCPFFETSAKDGVCVDDAFAEIVREIRTHCPPEPEPAKESKKSKLFKFLKRK